MPHDTQDGQQHMAFLLSWEGFTSFTARWEPVNPLIPDKKDISLHPLSIDLLRQGEFELTMPTEEEIKDEGENNWLAKGLVLVQTTWFVLYSSQNLRS